MKILIAGIGAIGSNLTKLLVPDLKGKHEITVLDYDAVEERNTTAGTQFYLPNQVKLPKVAALQFNIYNHYQRKIEILNAKLGRGGPTVFPGYDLIIDCLDNYNGRKWLQEMYDTGQHIDNGDNIYDVLHIGFSNKLTYAIEWADEYTVPTDTKGLDICEMPGAAAVINLVSSLGALVVEEFITNKKKLEIIGNRFNYTVIK